jgi:hypothetical protein
MRRDRAYMPTPSVAFARHFQNAFLRESSSSTFTEVEQFRALMRAFSSMKPTFYLEEFHGFKRQVYFDTTHVWQRKRARCELCDVLLIVYSTTGGFSVRMTLLQAKLSRKAHTTASSVSAGQIEPQDFKGNFEQWNLLSARPALIATTVFDPPPALLSGALLPSVGSFGVFHKLPSRQVDLFYVSADCLSPTSTPPRPDTRLGRLATKHGGPAQRTVGSWSEVAYCPTALDFARSLYELSIGTPVVFSSSTGGRTEYEPHYGWVRSVLAAHVSAAGDNSPIARALLDDLGTSQSLPELSKVPSLVILRSESPVNGPTKVA